jgi:beta-mannan synthase
MPLPIAAPQLAIFDADFHPDPSFLLKTIPYLHVRRSMRLGAGRCMRQPIDATLMRRCLAPGHAALRTQDNPDVGFVQARWVYANSNESLLTRVQEISLNYHIKVKSLLLAACCLLLAACCQRSPLGRLMRCTRVVHTLAQCEQYARFASGAFFNFNGTAGVWRRACIEKAGGWNNRTTVEDMDLSLRAYLQGWRFVFLYDVTCLNEVPSSYDAYRKQQHRWSCGPMQLWRKATSAVWHSNISWAMKLYLNSFFFGTRLFATHVVSFVFYCTLVPIAVIAPEVRIPFWALVYMPLLVTCSTVAFTPGCGAPGAACCGREGIGIECSEGSEGAHTRPVRAALTAPPAAPAAGCTPSRTSCSRTPCAW